LAWEYYHALSRATDNLGVLKIVVCAHAHTHSIFH
jgi:hypothetical protein